MTHLLSKNSRVCSLLMTLVVAAFALTGITARAQTLAPTVSEVSASAFDLLHLTSLPATSSILGQAVTFSVTVTGTAGTPTGSVYFTDGSSLVGIAQLNASGTASFPTSVLFPGSHSITASYKGNATYSAANSSGLAFTVNPRPVTTGLSAPASAVVGVGAPITGYVFDAATVGPGGTNGGPTGKSFPNATGPIFNLPAPRSGHAAAMLSDGSVLISGGTVAGSAVNNLVNYIPGTIIVPDERFVAVTGNMLQARSGHTATLLSDELTVLITGGDADGDAELYTFNLAAGTGSSAATGALQASRSGHTATLLPNGQVLIIGGTVGGAAVSSLEVYNSSGVASSAVTGQLAYARSNHTATLLNYSGSVATLLVAGGDATGTAELINFDTSSKTVTQVGSATWMTARYGHTASILADGKTILFTGGNLIGVTPAAAVASMELFQIPTNLTSFTSFTPLTAPTGLISARAFHTATALKNTFVVIIGGDTPITKTAEDFTPAFDPQGTLSFFDQYGTSEFTPVDCTLTITDAGASTCTSTLTPSGEGARNFTFTYASNGNHVTGGYNGGTIAVAPTQATVTLTVPSTAAYGQTGLSAVAGGGNGTGAYSYSAGSSTACTVDSTTGAITIMHGVGTCIITATKAADGTYSETSSAPQSITITKAVATVTPSAATKVYGTAEPTLSGTLSGFLAADNVTVSYVRAAGETVTGSPYTINAILDAAAGVLSNYAITNNPAAMTITKASLTATANNASMNYGASLPAFTGTLAGVVSGDVIAANFTTTATSTSSAGSYPITPVLDDPNGKLANYDVVLTNGTLAIGKVATTATVQTSTITALLKSSVTLTAKVTGTPRPTGSVSFMDGSTALGNANLDNTGTATLTVNNLTAGTHNITAAYVTNTNFTGSTSSSVTLTVQDFNFTANGGAVTVLSAATSNHIATYTLQLTPTVGSTFFGKVDFTLTGLPVGATYTISPSAIPAGSGATTITITVNTSAVRASNSLPWPNGGSAFPKPLVLAIFLPLLGTRKLRRALRLHLKSSALTLMLLSALLMAGITSCGSGRTAKNYTMALTGTSGTLQHSVTLNLTAR